MKKVVIHIPSYATRQSGVGQCNKAGGAMRQGNRQGRVTCRERKLDATMAWCRLVGLLHGEKDRGTRR